MSMLRLRNYSSSYVTRHKDASMNRAKKLCQGLHGRACGRDCSARRVMHCTEALSNPLNMLLATVSAHAEGIFLVIGMYSTRWAPSSVTKTLDLFAQGRWAYIFPLQNWMALRGSCRSLICTSASTTTCPSARSCMATSWETSGAACLCTILAGPTLTGLLWHCQRTQTSNA